MMARSKESPKTAPNSLNAKAAAAHINSMIREMRKAEKKFSTLFAGLHDNFALSGRNLIHYLVLRSQEIRSLQDYLHHKGLSSLANSESHTLSQLYRVLHWLKPEEKHSYKSGCTFEFASASRLRHAEELLGPFRLRDRPHIMVTFDSELMMERKLVEEMLNEGMTVARINCAHDNADTWKKMIGILRKAVVKTGKDCKIYMDLTGPKIRVSGIFTKKQGRPVEEVGIRKGKELVLCSKKSVSKLKKRGFKKDTLIVEPGELLAMLRKNEHVFFDDGKFEARVTRNDNGIVSARIIRISAKKHILKLERGINLPDSELAIPPLTKEDYRNIPFICDHADMIGYSFVSTPDDIELLRSEMHKYEGKRKPAIVLKIERLAAVQNLPALLLNGMKDEIFGVMIARGDLAVEIGFERLSEIQEEILWICEAAHVPVIWATQVLEGLNKTGYATRSEMTDAAMSVRSECVMLNKGKYIVKTIKTLDDVLTRQVGHLQKKRYIMRPLGLAKNFLKGSGV